MWLDNVNCGGSEENIWECFYDGSQYDLHNEDAGVMCFNTTSK